MNISLTDQEYFALLKKARQYLETVTWIVYDDCNDWGCKHMESNVGLCNDSLTWKEIALFPEEWPKRRAMKYRKVRHRCPLDQRKNPGMNGCFYTCDLFQGKITDIAEIKQRFDEQIAVTDKHINGDWSLVHELEKAISILQKLYDGFWNKQQKLDVKKQINKLKNKLDREKKLVSREWSHREKE